MQRRHQCLIEAAVVSHLGVAGQVDSPIKSQKLAQKRNSRDEELLVSKREPTAMLLYAAYV